MSKSRRRTPWYKRIPKKYLFLTALASFLLIGWLIYREATKYDWIVFQDDGFTAEERVIVRDAMQDWADVFQGCPVSVRVSTSQEMPVDEEGNFIDADAAPGEITFYIERIREPDPLRQRPLREIVLHETTHACKEPRSQSDTNFFNEHTWLISGELRIVGFEGFLIEVDRAEDRFYMLCEEGVAEWAASNVDHNYQSYHPGYHNMARFFFRLYGTSEETIRPILLNKRNDFWGFARDVTGQQNIGLAEIEQVMNICTQTYHAPNPNFPSSP